MFIPPFLQIIQRRGKCRPFRYFTTLGQMCNITVNVEHEDECNLKEIFANNKFSKNTKPPIQGWFDWLIGWSMSMPIGVPPKKTFVLICYFFWTRITFTCEPPQTFSKGRVGHSDILLHRVRCVISQWMKNMFLASGHLLHILRFTMLPFVA